MKAVCLLFYGQVYSLDVFKEHGFHLLLFGHFRYYTGKLRKACLFRGFQAAVTDYYIISSLCRNYGQVLEDSFCFYAVCKLRDVANLFARVLRVVE